MRQNDNTAKVDMSLLWVPGEYVALASAVLEGALTECGSTNRFLCTDSDSEFGYLQGQALSTSTPHPRRGSPLGPTYSTLLLRATPALYRRSAAFPPI